MSDSASRRPAFDQKARIGLCLSGGGYRAAAFHLGALSYLNRWRLLPQVQILSTVSGGSIVGAAWLLAATRGGQRWFSRFETDFTEKLRATDCAGLAVDDMCQNASSRAARGEPLSLARSLANVYDEQFFAGARFATIAGFTGPGIPDEVTINATEFREAYGYRFVRSRTRGKSGSYQRPAKKDWVDHARVADVVAASSCFPGLCEPIVYPDDFMFERQGSSSRPLTVPLMDGGIFDNQGIDALLLTLEREAVDPVDIVIISDTDRPPRQLLGDRPSPREWLRVGVDQVLVLAAILALVPLLAMASTRAFADALSAGIAAVALWTTALAVGLAYVVGQIPGWIRRRLWQVLCAVTCRQLAHLITVRVQSLVVLAADVFMARIRRLGYERVFAPPRVALGGVHKISNLIYHLRDQDEGDPLVLARSAERRDRYLRAIGFDPPRGELKRAIQHSFDCATTLWFPEASSSNPRDSRLCDDLVLAGRATMCFNLAKHTLRTIPIVSRELDERLASLRSDWDAMNQ